MFNTPTTNQAGRAATQARLEKVKGTKKDTTADCLLRQESCLESYAVDKKHNFFHLVRVERWSYSSRPLRNERAHSDVSRKRYADHALPVECALFHHGPSRPTLAEKHTGPCQAVIGRSGGGGASVGSGLRKSCVVGMDSIGRTAE